MTDLGPLHLENFFIYMNKIRPFPVPHGRILPPLSPVICHQSVIFWCTPPSPQGDDVIYVHSSAQYINNHTNCTMEKKKRFQIVHCQDSRTLITNTLWRSTVLAGCQSLIGRLQDNLKRKVKVTGCQPVVLILEKTRLITMMSRPNYIEGFCCSSCC